MMLTENDAVFNSARHLMEHIFEFLAFTWSVSASLTPLSGHIFWTTLKKTHLEIYIIPKKNPNFCSPSFALATLATLSFPHV